MYLFVPEYNKAANKFYEKMGFQLDKSRSTMRLTDCLWLSRTPLKYGHCGSVTLPKVPA